MALLFVFEKEKGTDKKSQKAEIKESQNSTIFLSKENLGVSPFELFFFSPKESPTYGLKFKLYCLSKRGLNPSNSLQKKVWNPLI
jgi:hypothetical protein